MFAIIYTLTVFLHYHISLLFRPTSFKRTIKSLFRRTKPPRQLNPHHLPPQNNPLDPPPIPPPDAIDVDSIYEATIPSQIRNQTVPRPPKTRINMAKHFIPWDGSLPTTFLTSQPHVDTPKIKHWLHRSSKRSVIKNPFGPGYQDSEQPPMEFPHPYPQPLRHDVSEFRRILPLSALFHNQLGTIVIPRHHNTSDLLLLVTHTDTATVPPKGPSSLLARFLVCSRTVLHYIPSIRGQASHQSTFHDGQRFYLPDGTNRIYPFFLFKLPQTDLTSLWLILTIIHQRFPTSWSNLDLPLPLLYNICKTLDILEISGTSTVHLIRQKLLYTLTRHAHLHHPPSDTPDIAMWLYIAKTFSISTNYSSLWAHLVLTTWRFTPSSHAVDRYTPDPPHPPSTNFKYGNWYWISHLPATLRQTLDQDRTTFLNTLLTPWSHFRSRYNLPYQSTATATTILNTTSSTIDFSAMDLKSHLLDYATDILTYHTNRSLVFNGPNKPLNPRILTDIITFQSTIQNCFSQVRSRDINNNPINVTDDQYLSTNTTPLYPPFQTPPELDPSSSSLEPTIFMYQSGANNNLIYWRNEPPSTDLLPKSMVLFSRKFQTQYICFFLTQIYIELFSLLNSRNFATLDLRITLWLLLGAYYLNRSTIKNFYALQKQSQKRREDEELLETKAINYNWSMDDEFSVPGSINPKGTPARIGHDWRKFTPWEGYPENTLLAARQEFEIRKFKRERAERWRKEGRDKWGRLPADEGFGVPPPPREDGAEEAEENVDDGGQEEEVVESAWNRQGGYGLFD
ncbi:hypothetical protein TWF506_004458 [Arthrobotrys conoides]|uniref:Uncharacterized protein n=1 Tax=Arthrobotrys conoides TaxID=74498 RepID=A0AAN8RPD0_9PEZI